MEVRVEIGGRTLVLKYTVNAMCAMEDVAGGALDTLMDRQFTAARLLLWGGMLECEPGVSLGEAGELIGEHLARGGTLEEVVEFCHEGLRRAGFFGKAARSPEECGVCAAGLTRSCGARRRPDTAGRRVCSA